MVDRANAWAWNSRPVRPSRRSIAIGSVSEPDRERKLVAPNSPSEIAAASPAPIAIGRRSTGVVVVSHARNGAAPRVDAAAR